MAAQFNLGFLWDDYFRALNRATNTFESTFAVQGVRAHIFGVDADEYELEHGEAAASAQARVKESAAWKRLVALFEYAAHGVLLENAEDVVIGGSEVLSLLKLENSGPAVEWEQIVRMGDGRFALDDEDDLSIDKLALLASVDVRTVRNAISAGELVALKLDGVTHVTNTSSRAWLAGRKGFIPTRRANEGAKALNEIDSPMDLGHFLISRRAALGIDLSKKKLLVFHSSVDARAIAAVESGSFTLPIDAAFPLADFYRVDRDEFLACVMRVFFKDQLTVLERTFKSS